MILIKKSKILEEQLYCVGNYSYKSHSYNFKPRKRESGNAWKVITENSAVRYSLFHSECQSSLGASELLPEQRLLDKALEIGEKIDKAGKTCEKLMIGLLMEKTKILKEQLQNDFKPHDMRNIKRTMINFQQIN